MSSPDSAYPITYMESMDVIQFTGHKFAILKKIVFILAKSIRNSKRMAKEYLFTRCGQQWKLKVGCYERMFINDKYQELVQTFLCRECLDETSDSKITKAQESQKSIIQNNHQKYNKPINDKDLNSITDKNQIRPKISLMDIFNIFNSLMNNCIGTFLLKKERNFRELSFSKAQVLWKTLNNLKTNKLIQISQVQLIYKKIGFVIVHDHNTNQTFSEKIQDLHSYSNISVN
ncbi:unnamed protein product (macronuclear) [Paramecium tetraurelia]|uniref:Uncharacterized protein n=1 Tax=Paramecium tetraurelia TaxID=5888 RepID=A0CKA9_PARTE|nr:uncharacterized protein GSPATT00000939001 [Paramecium tetraurelia]CAK71226.1 unnamed protein product [Paramecium tetraurelia]|eukprot:XP_001438623.1 hypothetical protein (macronuclear) [Paramecium tetraurelia strain d4-2]